MIAEQTQTEKTSNLWELGRMWYMIYLFAGVGINFVIHFTQPFGIIPGKSILWGSLLGLSIPLATMFIFSYVHQKLLQLWP